MNQRNLLFSIIVITVIITAILYNPVSLLIYKIREPYFRCPIEGKSKQIVIRNDDFGEGDFGTKRSNGRTHSGIDIQAPVNTPVFASKSGIAFCGKVPTGYGNYVMIYHPDGTQTFYGHLLQWCVLSSKKVKRGDLIGFVGKTGNAANKNIKPHLHFEIRKDGEPVDPRGLVR